MTHVDLLIGTGGPTSLKDFATRFFEILRLADVELRESENYVEGHYFIAKNGPKTFRVMLSADIDHLDLPYWIQISSTDAEPLRAVEIDELAFALIRLGYRVARIVNFGRIDEKRIDYPAS